jgi:DNA-binding MarR family transcriptional regulator
VTAPPTPLARLFAIAYRELIDGLHERLRERGWQDVRPAYGFVLLLARDHPVTVGSVGALMGATKQAASKLTAAMVEAGYLEAVEAEGDARRRPLRLSQRGKDLLDEVERIYGELEGAWAERIGSAAVQRMRRDLVRALPNPQDGELPAVRPIW